MPRRSFFWIKPTNRTYTYNLDVSEHYYSPMTSFLNDADERGLDRNCRGNSPGAMTFEERLQKKWLTGKRYDATTDPDPYARCRSMARGDYDADGSTDTIRKYSRKGLTLASELESTRASRARSESRARYNRAYGLSQGHHTVNYTSDRTYRRDISPYGQYDYHRDYLPSGHFSACPSGYGYSTSSSMIDSVTSRISMLEKEKEYLTRQLDSYARRPSIWQ